jgi:hypothetical protein
VDDAGNGSHQAFTPVQYDVGIVCYSQVGTTYRLPIRRLYRGTHLSPQAPVAVGMDAA